MPRRPPPDQPPAEEQPFWADPDYSRSGPIRVDGGIRAKSRRGTIGSTWWSRRFIGVLESLELGSRLGSGRAYARSGQVVALEVSPGAVAATVQGSRSDPYRVRVGLEVIKPLQWTRVERALAGQVIFSAKLLAGDMPEDLEDVFDELGLSLFPRSANELRMDCSCPDRSAVTCKHVAAALYLLAEAFDRDPFLVLAWRGRDRAELLGNLRRLRGASTVDSSAKRSSWHELLIVPGPPLEECVDDFLSCRGRVSRLARPPAEIMVPDAVLRERDPLPFVVDGQQIVVRLRPAYLAMGPISPDREP